MTEKYLVSARNQFAFYKEIGEKTMVQLSDEQLFWCPNKQSNSIANLIQHLSCNMLSRWTNFLNCTGEKEWRKYANGEEGEQRVSRLELENQWERGWRVLFSAIDNLNKEDLERIVFVNKEPQLVIQVINRQLAHYPYHIGQITFLAKLILNEKWEPISNFNKQTREYNGIVGA